MSWTHMFKSRFFLRGALTGSAFTTAYLLIIFGKKTKSLREEIEAEWKSKVSSAEMLSKEPVLAVAAKNLARGEQILKYGAPDRGPDLSYYSNHVLSYDRQKRTPMWVAEHITADKLKGNVSRKHVKFKPDPDVLEAFSAQNSDYLGSGWSRGHMSPAGDNKQDKDSMVESFYLSNIVPQNYENNAGFWNRFEIYCRDLTKKYSSVYVISGPLSLPQADEETGMKFVKYQAR